MARSRSIEPFEPILIEKRRKRRLSQRRLPDNAKQGRLRLIRLALQWRQNRGALGRVTIQRVGTRPKPELNQPPQLGRGQCEMSDLVQDHISFGRAVQCRPVPIKAAWGPFRIDRHAKAAREGECRETIPFDLPSDRAVSGSRADPLKYLAGKPVGETRHEAIESARELLARYRRQNHSAVRLVCVAILDGMRSAERIPCRPPVTTAGGFVM
jgi:hypothetical protein